MSKTKLITSGALGALVIAVGSLALFAQAATPLSATCSGSVASTTITWSSTVSGGVSPYSYLWSGPVIAGATTSMVAHTYSPGTYTSMLSVTDASSTVATTSCMATVAAPPPPTGTTTPPLPKFFKSPTLMINPGGHFSGRGMIVTSVASSSLVATVWGTTWTIVLNNPSGNPSEKLERDGKILWHVDPSTIMVGDEISVTGVIDPNTPLTVDAQIVRDFSLSPPILHDRGDEQDSNNNSQGNHGKNKNKGNKHGQGD